MHAHMQAEGGNDSAHEAGGYSSSAGTNVLLTCASLCLHCSLLSVPSWVQHLVGQAAHHAHTSQGNAAKEMSLQEGLFGRELFLGR